MATVTFPEGAYTETFPNPPEDSERYLYRRGNWLPGPWQDEPMDKIVWVDPATDLDCMMVRGFMGAWCGYVGVPEGHPAFQQPYPDLDLDVHGGLTFSDLCHEGGRICHVPKAGRPAHVWWLGFDCNHGTDLAPGMLSLERHMEQIDGTPGLWLRHRDYDPKTGTHTHFGFPEAYRDVAYVKAQVEHLAQQLYDMADRRAVA